MMWRKKGWAFFLIVAVVLAFSLPTLAKEKIKGTVEAVDMNAKKVKINGTEYNLGGETAEADLEAGDEIEGTTDKGSLIGIDSVTRKLSG